ncbi:hypothetical protein ACWDPP_40170, partial [Streptomyces sp. NPDC000851]
MPASGEGTEGRAPTPGPRLHDITVAEITYSNSNSNSNSISVAEYAVMQILAAVDSYLPATSGSPPAMKCATCIASTARALIFDRDAVARALESGHLAGYDGDVVRESLERWFDNCPIRQEYL